MFDNEFKVCERPIFLSFKIYFTDLKKVFSLLRYNLERGRSYNQSFGPPGKREEMRFVGIGVALRARGRGRCWGVSSECSAVRMVGGFMLLCSHDSSAVLGSIALYQASLGGWYSWTLVGCGLDNK